MEPAVGLILILAWAGVNAIIARKRGLSGLAFFGLSVLPILPVAIIVSAGTGGNGSWMAGAVFLCPLIGFIAAINARSGKEVAATEGAHGEYVRCPFCAEPVRRLAIKCRHCTSDLTTDLPGSATGDQPMPGTLP